MRYDSGSQARGDGGGGVMNFVQNQYIQLAAVLSALISAPLVILQSMRELGPALRNIKTYKEASRRHLHKVTDLSIDSQGYMAACVLILLVRIIAALFGVVVSALLVVISLFLHMSNQASQIVDITSLVFLAASSIFLFGTLASAKRFSDMAREKIAKGSTEGRKLF
jgi:hypothetical protein